ncbi:hypothetical protein A7U60_g9012 [Sanghuangporus baumii]|uniref:Sterol regulatory element-binding protein cleavage-activating protein n=1 Tax=Sanghuangporus baumii TaxID=108892 RepID=A0A9Q5MY67_SANBA|nr:hypothetical protein A7U60_g9012 [Sanghuangporus baumii]
MIGIDTFRVWSSKFFHRFGIHCATHQIRLILISGLVITSLFYPAIGIYSDSVRRFLPSSSPRIVGRWFGLTTQPLWDFQDDLDNVWNGYECLHILEDTVARAKCGTEKTVRVERVFLTSNGFDSDAGAINYNLLQSALQLETDLADRLSSSSLTCLSVPLRGCLVLSPLEFWSHNERALRSDPNVLRTVNKQQNVSVAGLPLKPSMVFARRESSEPGSLIIDFAAYLVLTYFFRDEDCNSSNGHRAWLNILHDIAPLGEIPRLLQDPLLQALEFNPEKKPAQKVSLITVTLYVSYLIFFAYFSGSMRRLDTVHSRIGLCFTGMVEILIDDVTKTPISLPVKERIGIGLSRAGTSNTLKVVSYNSILGIIGFFSHGPIRQFCAFAIVVLVAHWFLIHTFFVAVLSIDIQRLELDDLLRQDPNLAPRGSASTNAKPSAKVNVFSRFAAGLQKATKGRLAKNFSLMLLLVITATLYYSTLPVSERQADSKLTPATRASVREAKAAHFKLDVHTDAQRIWRTLSGEETKLVHLKIETPTILVFDHEHGNIIGEHRVHRLRWSARTLRMLWWIFKVMVVPIGVTLSALYALLLYLLKGTDRLENRRNDGGTEAEELPAPMDSPPFFKTFPRAFASDVGLLASSKDGSVLVSVSSDGEVFIWIAALQNFIPVNTSDILLKSAATSSVQSPLCAVAIDDNATCFAVGTGSGTIGIWTIHGDTIYPTTQLYLDECASPVTQIEFYGRSTRNSSIIEDTAARNHEPAVPGVLAVYANGRVVQWSNGVPVNCRPACCIDVKRAKVIRPSGTAFPAVCFFSDDGELEIVDVCQSFIPEGRIAILAGTPEDYIMDVHACTLRIEDTPHILIVAATFSGIISLWDGSTGERISTLDINYGFVNNLRLLPTPSKACSQCGEVPLCSFSLVYSVGHIVLIDRGILARRCSCPLQQPLAAKIGSYKDNSIGRRSRSGSFVSSSGADWTPLTRSRHTSVSGENGQIVNSFPVSGHGIHSRRVSERDFSRRGNDKFDVPAFLALEDLNGAALDGDDSSSLGRQDITRKSSASDLSTLNLWRNFRLVRVREATCERGGWDILNGKILGLRRKPRKRYSASDDFMKYPVKLSQQTTLSPSVLERWEVWIIDPSKADGPLQASSLSMLRLKVVHTEAVGEASSRKPVPRLSFTRLSPLIIKSSICLAGFGNTIGMIYFGS